MIKRVVQRQSGKYKARLARLLINRVDFCYSKVSYESCIICLVLIKYSSFLLNLVKKMATMTVQSGTTNPPNATSVLMAVRFLSLY